MKAAFNKVEAPWISFVQIRGLVWSAIRREYKGWAMAEKLEMQFLQCPANPKKLWVIFWFGGKEKFKYSESYLDLKGDLAQ